jgi:hypothetical protein
MDPANISWLEADDADDYWEADRRRDYTEGGCIRWNRDSEPLSTVARYYQEIGDDLGRRLRMAEAIYDC